MGRSRKFAIDPLEPRNLLSITPLINSPGWLQSEVAGSTGSNSGGQGSNGSTGAPLVVLNPSTGIYENANLGGSGTTTDVTPPRQGELVRRDFTAKFGGRVIEEPPRLLDQAHQFFILAPGTSTAFLHGTAQLRYYTPTLHPVTFPNPSDPTGPPLIEQVTSTTGTISMADRSTQSGTVILANLTGSPADKDRLGRPTRFNLNLNGGSSGGLYASSVGTGTVVIRYRGNNATITVHASIYVSGVGNPYDIYQGIHL